MAEHRALLGVGSKALVVVLLALSFSARTGTASNGSPPEQVDPRGFPKASYHEGLAAVRLGEGYGYIDRGGRVVIPPRYQSAGGFSEGLARIEIEDRYGYIDRTGRVVIEPRFQKAFKFSDGLARVCRPPEHRSFLFHRILRWDDREAYPCGYVDRQGKLVIDYEYLPSHGFRNGYARVTTLDGREGYIDHAGRFEPTHEPVAPVEIADAVADALHDYAQAQLKYFARHGRFGRELSDLSDLPSGMDGANLENPGDDFHGYLFEPVEMNGAVQMDYGKDFTLVAFPARYLVTGQASYAIGPKGIVIMGNSHGDPVLNATQLGDWQPLTN